MGNICLFVFPAMSFLDLLPRSCWPQKMTSEILSSLLCYVKVKVAQSCLTLRPHGLFRPRNSPGQNTGVGSVSLLQGIFPTQGANPGLPHSLPSLYHKGSPLSYVRVCIKLAYFFLKCLVEFISQPI